MEYKKIRKEKGYYAYFMAHKLGVEFKFYTDVEKGIKTLSGEKLDYFNEIVNDKSYLVEQSTLVQEAKTWYKDTDIVKCYKKYGYRNDTLAECFGVSVSYISKVSVKSYYSEDLVLGLYLFLNNESNKIYLKSIKKTPSDSNNLKKELSEMRLTLCEREKEIAVLKEQLNKYDVNILALRCKAYETLLLQYQIK